jgi:cytochrome P450
MDIINDLAVLLSLSVLAELLGITAPLPPDLNHWIQAWTSSSQEELMSQVPRDLEATLLDALAHRRRHPQQDVLSRLLLTEIGGLRLSERDMVWCCHVLLMSGLVTIPHVLGNALLCLVEHPEVIERLRNVPAPIYSTIDEVLRYLPPVWMVQRTTRSAVTLGKQSLPAQARISAWIVSANRDVGHFARPEEFDIDRIPNRHLSFGDNGVHSCLGVGLCRLITKITLELLSQQFTDIKLLPGYEGAVVVSPTLFGVNQLPITFRPVPGTRHPL